MVYSACLARGQTFTASSCAIVALYVLFQLFKFALWAFEANVLTEHPLITLSSVPLCWCKCGMTGTS